MNIVTNTYYPQYVSGQFKSDSSLSDGLVLTHEVTDNPVHSGAILFTIDPELHQLIFKPIFPRVDGPNSNMLLLEPYQVANKGSSTVTPKDIARNRYEKLAPSIANNMNKVNSLDPSFAEFVYVDTTGAVNVLALIYIDHKTFNVAFAAMDFIRLPIIKSNNNVDYTVMDFAINQLIANHGVREDNEEVLKAVVTSSEFISLISGVYINLKTTPVQSKPQVEASTAVVDIVVKEEPKQVPEQPQQTEIAVESQVTKQQDDDDEADAHEVIKYLFLSRRINKAYIEFTENEIANIASEYSSPELAGKMLELFKEKTKEAEKEFQEQLLAILNKNA